MPYCTWYQNSPALALQHVYNQRSGRILLVCRKPPVQQIGLMLELNKHPKATLMPLVRGESMRDASILDGAVVLIGMAIKKANGQIVIALVNGEFTLRKL